MKHITRDIIRNEKGVLYLSEVQGQSFEDLYLKVRERENRILNDEELKNLPETSVDHPHHKEWKIRADTAFVFGQYLKKKTGELQILDLGCGNGWFAAKMALLPNVSVTGLDVNRQELEQASRVFHFPNLQFAYGDIFEAILPAETFDLITLNSVIQYFPDLKQLLTRLYTLLKAEGEIHLLNSHLYKTKELGLARKRSQLYYQKLGFPEMAQHYFHHSWEELRAFHWEKLHFQPSFWLKIRNRLWPKKSPFPWLRITKPGR